MSETSRNDADASGTNQAEALDLAAFMSDFEKQMAALRERAEPLQYLIDATSVRNESEGGEVAVTVTISGALIDVEFLPAAAAVAPVDLAAMIVGTYERAAAAAREHTPDIVEGFVDHNSRTRNLARRLIEHAATERAVRHDEAS